MMPRRTDREQARPRLVPQPSGYAVYVDQPQPPGTGPRRPPSHALAGRGFRDRDGRPRGPGRQRSIRSTLALLLILPLISMIGLWAFAAASTAGAALGTRTEDSINRQVGAPTQRLFERLQVERSLTFAWQSTSPRPSEKALDAQRALTDQAVTAFRAGVVATAHYVPAADKSVTTTLLAKLGQLGALRARVDAGKVTALAAFQDYNATQQSVYPFVGSMSNPQESLGYYQEGQAGLLLGQAVDAVAQEAALVGGALAAGGKMPPALYRQFTLTVDNQRLLAQLGNSPVEWQRGPDPYGPVFNSAAFARLRTMENAIVAAGPGARIPFAPQAWLASVQSFFTGAAAAGTAFQSGSTAGQAHDGDMVLLRLILVGGAGLLLVAVASFLLLRFGNRIRRELTALRGAARTLAGERLPGVVSRLRAGADVDVAAEAPPLVLGTHVREVTDTADAFSVVQLTAVEAAVQQAQLRKGVSLVFRSLARRNQSLLQRQLQMLDEMERRTEDADALAQLFRLDHLTTRMRRQAEGLIILSGASPGRVWRQPVPVIEVLRGAVGEIEGYERVDLIAEPRDFVLGTTVADLIHVLAELVENAVQFSPPGTRVQVRGGRVANGYSIEVEDKGVGIAPATMSAFNERLANPPEFDLVDGDQLGLFVVSRLAARHGVMVSLRRSGFGGTTAIVLLPHALAIAEEDIPAADPPAAAAYAAAEAGPVPATKSSAEVLAGRRVPRNWGALSPAPVVEPPARPADGLLRPPPTEWLPRRQAGASLAPGLRERHAAPAAGPLPGPAAYSPEQARALMSAIQVGSRSGRAAGLPPDDSGSYQDPTGGAK